MLELFLLSAISALLGLGCLGAVGWALVGAEDTGVEQIFLVLVWLLLAVVFLGMSAWIARQGPLKQLGKKPAEANFAKAKEASAQQQEAAREEVQKPAS